MTEKEKSTIQECLVTLYLRLNGYFTSGLIIHSDGKEIKGELDIIAVRFPFHKQDDTEHNSSEYLEIPSHIDVIVGEVKSKGQQLQFNDCLMQQESLNPWQKILLWIGILKEEQINSIAIELNQLVQTSPNSQLKTLRSTKPTQTSFGNLTIRPVIFSPERINNNNADKFISWSELNDFIWLCLCPSEEREFCGTRYDFTSWGSGLFEIVKSYKDRQKNQIKFSTIDELYSDIQTRKEKQLKKSS